MGIKEYIHNKQNNSNNKQYLCKDIQVAYDSDGVIGAFVMNTEQDKIKDLSTGKEINVYSWLQIQDLLQYYTKEERDQFAQSINVDDYFEIPDKANKLIALALLYRLGISNDTHDVSNLDITKFPEIHEIDDVDCDYLQWLTYKHTFGIGVPGKAFHDTRKEIAKSYVDKVYHSKDLAISLLGDTIVTYQDLIPLLNRISNNMRKKRVYESKRDKEKAAEVARDNLNF